MLRHTALVTVILTSLSVPALAADMPDFLKQKYATDPAACKATQGDSENYALTLEEGGIFGLEFSCTFVEVWPGDNNTATALVSCSDDSGITRPDMLSIAKYDNGEVHIQSQNEYVMGSIALSFAPPPADDANKTDDASKTDGENAELNFDFVTATYAPCPAK